MNNEKIVNDDLFNLLPRGSAAGLDLVHEIDNVVFLAQSLQTLEPFVGPVMVATLGLKIIRNSYKV